MATTSPIRQRPSHCGGVLLAAVLGFMPLPALAAPTFPVMPVPPLSSVGRWLVDGTGRVVLLHGVNDVNKQAPFYSAARGFGEVHRLAAQLDGGGHERGMRSGTLNVPGIVGFGAAAEVGERDMANEATRLTALRTRLLEELQRHVGDLIVNGSFDARLPGNLNVSFPGVDGEALLVSLCEDVALSSGAACTAAEPSHVLKAMGFPAHRTQNSIRFSLGMGNADADIDRVLEVLPRVVEKLRSLSRAPVRA